jgi:hypothetical protein
MTIAQPSARTYHILGEEFELDELRDIANHGARGGVAGFTYSSDLRDIWDKHEDVITDYLDGFCDECYGQSSLSYIAEQLQHDDKFWTMQQVIELACWMYLELRAQDIVRTVDGDW